MTRSESLYKEGKVWTSLGICEIVTEEYVQDNRLLLVDSESQIVNNIECYVHIYCDEIHNLFVVIE